MNGAANHRRRPQSSAEATIAGVLGFLFRSQQGLVLMNALLMAVLLLNGMRTNDVYQPSAVYGTANANTNANTNTNTNTDKNGSSPRALSTPSVRSPANQPQQEQPAPPETVRSEPCPEIPPPPPPLSKQPKQKAATTTSSNNNNNNNNNIVEYNDAEIGKTATVMAMGTNYHLYDYQRYVGSLRKTGFEGNIIVAVAPNIDEESEEYLRSKNVIVHKVKYVECSHPVKDPSKVNESDQHDKEVVTCLDPYPSLKHRWARFPLLRDYLLDCGGHPQPEIKCGGPVLVSDMRDTVFQRNPFGPEAPRVTGLQVFAEHYTIRTTHWLVDWPVGDCKGVHYDEPMLCSGTTIGTRRAMLDYLGIFHDEMNAWMEDPKCCCFDTNADDQSMHNYLFYSGALDAVDGGAIAVPNRFGLVNTVGAQASLIFETHRKTTEELLKAKNEPSDKFFDVPFALSSNENENERTNWLGLHYGMTDAEGYFVNYDGSRSFVIHQFDRFGRWFDRFLEARKERYFHP